MGESDRAQDSCGDVEMRLYVDSLWGFGPDASAIGGRAGDAIGLPVVGDGLSRPAEEPNGNAAGGLWLRN